MKSNRAAPDLVRISRFKVAIDAWTTGGSVTEGQVFRSVNRSDQVLEAPMSEKVVWQLLQPYAEAAGLVSSPPLRNAGTIRAQFDTPALGAGTEELEADLRRAVDAGLLAPHDARYMAAAMVGAAFELAIRMLESDPPDVEGAVNFATSLFAPGLAR